jgi:hypothetical protein
VIYGRFGEEITIMRMAVLADVRRLEGRRPDKQDREAVKHGCYVVCRDGDGLERLYHQAFMRADEGSVEIQRALAALEESRS